jgi:hypothetical protein
MMIWIAAAAVAATNNTAQALKRFTVVLVLAEP